MSDESHVESSEAADQAAPPEPTIADVLSAFEGYKKKTNGELAKLRREAKGREAPAPAPSESDPPPGANGFGEDQVKALIELGKHESGMPSELLERFADRYHAAPVQYRALIAEMIAAHAAGQQARGGTPDRDPTARAPVSAPRSTVPYPTTQSEYGRIARTDPKRKAALDADPNFDVSTLQFC